IGVALDRFPQIAAGGRAWARVVAVALEAFDVVLAWPTRLVAAEARRLSALGRERGAVLVVCGPGWPERADLRLEAGASPGASPGGAPPGRRPPPAIHGTGPSRSWPRVAFGRAPGPRGPKECHRGSGGARPRADVPAWSWSRTTPPGTPVRSSRSRPRSRP